MNTVGIVCIIIVMAEQKDLTLPANEGSGDTGKVLLDRSERKKLKKRSKAVLKKHYTLLLILSIIAIIIGSEFSGGALFLRATDNNLPIPGSQNLPAAREEVLNRAVFKDPGQDVFRDIISGNVIEGVQLSDELQEHFTSSGNGVMGHTEGVLASTVNVITSGHLYVKVIQSIITITKSPRASVIIFVLASILVFSLFFALVCETYSVIMRRMFLEARTYDKIPLHHFFHLRHSRRWIRASACIVYKDFIYALWFFTIIGGFVKRYSYYMVPYIVAENPDIRPREAVALSRRMMDGHKMECFKLELSFLGWLGLGFLTIGILNVFFYAPYKLVSMSEYYVRVRRDAIDKKITGYDMLDDHYLVEKADPSLLNEIYRDALEERANLDKYKSDLKGVHKFFAENFALWTGSLVGKDEYQHNENRKFKLNGQLDSVNGLAYPDRLDPRLREMPVVERIQIDFLRCYTPWNLLLMFFLFAFVGWVWEVILFILQTGEFVNRGSLYGPWVPIYGAGGTLILVLLCKFRTRPLIEFFSIAILSGVVEYATSFVQEQMTGMRYWDYSGYLFNLNGRICAEGLFAFAALGSLVVFFLAPSLDSLFMKINYKVLRSVTITLMVLFTGDVIYAHFHPHVGKGITDMGQMDPLPLEEAMTPEDRI